MTLVPFRPGFSARSKSKYHNVRTLHDGITFDSAHEATRYAQLKLLERAGEITDLQLQVPFKITINGQLVCTYKADFTYTDRRTGRPVVEDAKGCSTREYRIKKNLMRAVLGIEIVEV